MRVAILGLVAVSVALLPVGYAEARKHHEKLPRQVHRAYPAEVQYGTQAPLLPYAPHNAAVEGNNANSMSGSNSAPENANGRTNCC